VTPGLARTIRHKKQDQANPFGSFRRECETALKTGYLSLQKTSGHSLPDFDIVSTLKDPPNPTFGHLASSLSFELAKIEKRKPIEVAKTLAETSKRLATLDLVESVEATEPGYVNFRANLARLTELTLKSVQLAGSGYGLLKTEAPERTIVEHTSANPARPIHIGTAKNSIFGDALARLLSARGHDVRTHFYIDDTGRQTST